MNVHLPDTATLQQDRVVPLDLADEALRENFIAEIAEWAKHPPFYAVHGGSLQVIVSRYKDAIEVYRDRERFSVKVPKAPGFERFDKFMGVVTLAQMDGEHHDRIRRLMSPAFNPRAITALEPEIIETIDDLFDRAEATGRQFDAMGDFATYLMPRILLDLMFRLDAPQKAAFTRMSEVIPMATRIPPGGEFPQEYKDAFAHSRTVINALIDERRSNPGDDFVSVLVTTKEQGDQLTDTELYDQIFTVTASALQSTASSFAAIVYVLLKFRDQWEELKRRPELVPQAIEECLRYHGAGFLSFPRFATVDTEVGGTEIRQGMTLRISPQGACLDPEHYPDPLKVDIHRNPKDLLIFGGGPHLCLGNRLARFVLQVSLERFLRRYPDARLADPDFRPSYRGQVSETQIASLPLVLR
jgi:cytochrome P450